MLFLSIQAIGVIHSISDVSNEFLNFPLVRWSHVTYRPVTSGNGEILVVIFGNREIFFSSACCQE